MKFLAVLALTPLVLGVAMPRALDSENLPDGRYVATVHPDGSEKTTFVPLDQIDNPQFTPLAVEIATNTSSISRRDVEKRNGCEGFILNDSEVDRANSCVLSFTSLDPVLLGFHQKVSCVVGGAKSYICAYDSGSKSKFEIGFSWGFIRSTQCGPQRAGWNAVNGGSGHWDAGFTLNTAGFCGF